MPMPKSSRLAFSPFQSADRALPGSREASRKPRVRQLGFLSAMRRAPLTQPPPLPPPQASLGAAASAPPANVADRLKGDGPPEPADDRARASVPDGANGSSWCPGCSKSITSRAKWLEGAADQVMYDPKEGLLAIFLRWHGTVLPMVLQRPVFWMLSAFHMTLLAIQEHGFEFPHFDPAVGMLPASLLIYMCVFYNSFCYTRFFQLWSLMGKLSSIVNSWMLQTAFIFEELDGADGVRDGKSGDVELIDAIWSAARRIISSQALLLMALDVEITDADWLGRPRVMPNVMRGDGLDEEEYELLTMQGLITEPERRSLQAFAGLKCQLPLKWALNELRILCKPVDRNANQAKNYEACQELAAEFNKTAVRAVTLMQQPVPFIYFHFLKLMSVVVISLISYELVVVVSYSWPLSMVMFGTIAAMLLALQDIACAMADPFGTDTTDFDTHKLVMDAYTNAIAYLRTHKGAPPLRPTDSGTLLWVKVPPGTATGIGLVPSDHGQHALVGDVVPGSFAQAAGIIVGCRVASVNFRSTNGLTAQQVTALVRHAATSEHDRLIAFTPPRGPSSRAPKSPP